MNSQHVAMIVLAAACVALNLAVGSVVFLLKLPIYLDSIGIAVMGLLVPGSRITAFFWAAAVGVISFVMGGLLVNPFLPWFSLTAVAGAAYAAFILRGRFTSFIESHSRTFSIAVLGKIILYGVTWGLIAAVISAPIVVYLFGGSTGSGTALIVAFFVRTGQQLLNAAILSGVAAEPIDKTLQLICAILIAQSTPRAFLTQLGRQT